MKSLCNLSPACCMGFTVLGTTSRPGSGHTALSLPHHFPAADGAEADSLGHSLPAVAPSQPLGHPLHRSLRLLRILPTPAILGTAPHRWGTRKAGLWPRPMERMRLQGEGMRGRILL